MTVQLDDLGDVITTATGARCGNHGGDRVHHADAASVKQCYRITRERDADMQAEYDMERRYVEHLESQGYDEARAQEAHDARMGNVSFSDAWDLAGR